MQLVLLVHDTEFSCAPPPGSRGDGLGTIVQVLPFQVSARVKSWYALVPAMRPRNVPTATQLVAAGQDTPARLALITDGDAVADAGPAISAARQQADRAASARGASLRSAKRLLFAVTAILRG
jgi:hypothetical protein